MTRKSKSKAAGKNLAAKFLRTKRGIASALAVFLMLIGLVSPDCRDQVANVLDVAGFADPNKPMSSRTKSPLTEGVYPVVHVVDGDTMDVQDRNGAKHRLRLVGADTPETVKPNTPVQPFGPEASAFTKKTVAAAGNQVRIAFDGDQIDKYGRNLAMIYLTLSDGTEIWLNELLIRQGLARSQLQYRFSRGAKEKFRQAEEEAKKAKRNLWSIQHVSP